MRSLLVHPNNLKIEREWGRMCLVLLPDSQAIRWSLDAKSDTGSHEDKQRNES